MDRRWKSVEVTFGGRYGGKNRESWREKIWFSFQNIIENYVVFELLRKGGRFVKSGEVMWMEDFGGYLWRKEERWREKNIIFMSNYLTKRLF